MAGTSRLAFLEDSFSHLFLIRRFFHYDGRGCPPRPLLSEGLRSEELLFLKPSPPRSVPTVVQYHMGSAGFDNT